MPVYAVKELKAGVLTNWVWLHNKLWQTRSHAKTLEALGRQVRKKNLVATALEALADLETACKTSLGQLEEAYGASANPGRVAADRLRLAAKVRIMQAWRKRYSFAVPVQPLACYPEEAPRELQDGLLSCKPTACEMRSGCVLASEMHKRQEELERLRNALTRQPASAENQRRAEALKAVGLGRSLTNHQCRALGDAVITFFAPPGSVILTTNLRDHEPLAAALGKRAESP